MDISTKIVETLNGHTVEFSIGVQTFYLKQIDTWSKYRNFIKERGKR